MKHDVSDTGTGKKTARRPASGAEQGGQPDAEKQEMMKKAEIARAPGPEHKALEHFVGSWKCEVKCWMEPGGTPQESAGTAKVSWIMNGRFLQEDFKGEMMGKPFNGRTVLGFNNVKKAYQLSWIDDMNTSIFFCEGKSDGKTLSLEGKSSCPVSGKSDIPMKLVFRTKSPDQHVLEMFDASQNNAKTMEISYTKQ